MTDDQFLRIRSPEFEAMAARVVRATELTSRLNVLPFGDEAGRAALLELILGRPLPERVTVYPPFYTDHGLNLELSERVFINQGCTFLDYAGIRLAERVMVARKSPSSQWATPSTRVCGASGYRGRRSRSRRTPGSAPGP